MLAMRTQTTQVCFCDTLLNSHAQMLTKQHNPLLQAKAYNLLVVSIYNGAYFLLAKTMHLYLQSCMRYNIHFLESSVA